MKTTRIEPIRAPTGSSISAKSWLTEAPLRMLMNNLDPEVAERPEDLVVYGGIGKAARNWESYERLTETLRELEADETLVVQSGKPVGVFRTHADAPRVLIANSNLVPAWATWEHFRELDRLGLMMFGQMTAGSWIYIGSQGIIQGTYETFVEMGRQHYGGDLSGRWILTAGLGGMGGAQPLAAKLAGASLLAIECQADRIEKRLETGYVDMRAESLDEALTVIQASVEARSPLSVGLLGNAAETLPELLARGVRPDALTDQTSAHDPANGYLPIGWSVDEWRARRETDPDAVATAARESIAVHVRAMLGFSEAGVPTFDYGNNIRQEALGAGVENAFDFPVSCRHTSDPCSAGASVPSAGPPVRRSRGHLPHRREGQGTDSRRPAPAQLAGCRTRADPVPGAAGADLLGGPGPASPDRPRLQRDGPNRRVACTCRHRPRSPGQRLRRKPEPRDRGDARRLRRGLRLGVPQRDAEHRQRRHLGPLCITAAESAWGTPSTPGSSSSATAARPPTGG